jgi:hypothetical protein
MLIKLAGALICCLTHVHGLFLPSFICLLIPLKPLVISVIIRVPMGVLLGELALSIGLGI